MTRELRQVAGPEEHARAWPAGLRVVALTAALGLSLGSCLVTENKDLVAPTDVPVVRALEPGLLSPVPFGSDPDCTGVVEARAMKFQVSVRYQDTGSDQLFLSMFVNNTKIDNLQQQLKKTETRSVDRVPATLCIAESALDRPCSLVRVVVSSNFEKVKTTAFIEDPDVDSAFWFVLGSAEKYADADLRNDCLALVSRPDGGS